MSNPRPMSVAERSRLNRQRRPMPSAVQQLRNAATAAVAIAADVAHGRPPLVDSATADTRLAICLAPCAELDVTRGRCAACGCFVRAKAAIASQRCPLGYW